MEESSSTSSSLEKLFDDGECCILTVLDDADSNNMSNSAVVVYPLVDAASVLSDVYNKRQSEVSCFNNRSTGYLSCGYINRMSVTDTLPLATQEIKGHNDRTCCHPAASSISSQHAAYRLAGY